MPDRPHVVVPRTVEQSQLLAVCEVLGVNPAGVRSIRIGRGYVDVTVRMAPGDGAE